MRQNNGFVILLVVIGVCGLSFSLPFVISRMSNPKLFDPDLIIPNTGLGTFTPTSTDHILTVEAFARQFFTPTQAPKVSQTFAPPSPTVPPPPTLTFTASAISANTATVTFTPFLIVSPTYTSRALPSTPTHTPSFTPVPTATATFTPSPTLTPPPTWTPLPTDTDTPVPTSTDTPKPPPTDTPEPPPSDTPEPT